MTTDHASEKTFDPTTNPDVQEALSRAQGNSTITILVLRSGRIALFDRAGTLQSIHDEIPTREELRQIAHDCEMSTKALLARYAEDRFHGEPSASTQARDLRQAGREFFRPTRVVRPIVEGLDL